MICRRNVDVVILHHDGLGAGLELNLLHKRLRAERGAHFDRLWQHCKHVGVMMAEADRRLGPRETKLARSLAVEAKEDGDVVLVEQHLLVWQQARHGRLIATGRE